MGVKNPRNDSYFLSNFQEEMSHFSGEQKSQEKGVFAFILLHRK
jgi:hypothetical protein